MGAWQMSSRRKPLHGETQCSIWRKKRLLICLGRRRGSQRYENPAGGRSAQSSPTPYRIRATSMRILLIEDDRPIARGIQSSLEQAGFTVDMVHDGIFAEQALTQNRHELVILDLGLPGIDGMTLLSRFRQGNRHTPVIILTARDELHDRVQGLNSGADDYMLKPFEPAELEARIRAVMRRSGPHGDVPRPEVSLGGLRLSGVDRRIFNDEKPLELSPREFAVLEMLLLRHGRVVSKAQLQDHLTHFGGDLGDTAIEVYVHRVRKKLENCRVEIVTVRGFGYLLQEIRQAA